MSFGQLKDFFEHYTGLERDALHIHAALLLYILAMWVFRKNRKSRFPWLVVLGVELANECYDLARASGADPAVALSAAAKDLWNTMLWPTVLLLLGRYTSWFRRPRESGEKLDRGFREDADGDGDSTLAPPPMPVRLRHSCSRPEKTNLASLRQAEPEKIDCPTITFGPDQPMSEIQAKG